MGLFGIYLANGIVVGSAYVLAAIGLTIIFSIMRIVNFAHGECYMMGAYMAWLVVTRLVSNFWLGLFLAVLGGALMGYLIERFAFRPIYKTPGLSQFIISLGLVIMLQELSIISFTGLTQTMPSAYPTVRRIGNFVITDQRILVVGMAAVLVVAILLFFKRTKTGKAMRATAQNKLASSMMGINASRMASLAFLGGVGIAAVAGALLAPIFALTPTMGGRLTGLCFIIIVIGGMGSIGGAIIVGYTLGITESLFSAYVSTKWSFMLVFLMLMLILKFRPRGLFGRD